MKIRPTENLKEITLLYVEDDAEIREVMAGMLKRYVGKLLVASNGEEGLEIFKKERPEIVLSDVRMPKMDGIRMAEEIKKVDPKSALIFATAFGDTEYLQKAIDIGAQGYLVKPIERDKLIEKLNFIGDAIVNAKQKEAYLKLIHTLFNAQKDMLVLLDSHGQIHLWNDAFEHFCHALGCGHKKSFLELAERIDSFRELLGQYPNDLYEALQKIRHSIVEYNGKEGRRYFKIHTVEVDHFILLEFSDVTEMKLEAAALKEENMIDALTQIHNRKIVSRIVQGMTGYGHGCITMADIDRFKQINDTYGHLVGDTVLKILVGRIRSRIRQDDFLIRWGGEEFLIVMRTDMDHAVKIAEALRKVVNAKPVERVGDVTMSFGVCCGTIKSEKDFFDLIERADEALYAAKKAGRDRVVSCRDLNEAFEKRC